MLFDEIEKASDALWNLFLGILDKGTLALDDNSKADFSATMIFMTSNLGAADMSALVNPKLGFHAPAPEDNATNPALSGRVSRVGVEAARRKFTPEFINRLDKIIVFNALGKVKLNRIVDIELRLVQQRINRALGNKRFIIHLGNNILD